MTDKTTDLLGRIALIENLVYMRKLKRIRQVDIAESMGIGQPAVSEFERGVTDMKFSTLQKYARALGVEMKIEFVELEE